MRQHTPCRSGRTLTGTGQDTPTPEWHPVNRVREHERRRPRSRSHDTFAAQQGGRALTSQAKPVSYAYYITDLRPPENPDGPSARKPQSPTAHNVCLGSHHRNRVPRSRRCRQALSSWRTPMTTWRPRVFGRYLRSKKPYFLKNLYSEIIVIEQSFRSFELIS